MTKGAMAFPINRCHQRVVTGGWSSLAAVKRYLQFPINRCHQRVVTSPRPGG